MTAGWSEAGVHDAYGRRAVEYADLLGTMDATAAADRRTVDAWARTCTGPLLDLGCGPGHWTSHLRGRGHEVIGIDPVPQFVALARERHPQADIRQGSLADLAGGRVIPPGALPQAWGGVLAWYSLIHLPPFELAEALRQVHGVIAPGGGLLMGFCVGERVEPFGHAVTTAWFWPVDALAAAAEAAGFAVLRSHQRHDPGSRPHGDLELRRR